MPSKTQRPTTLQRRSTSGSNKLTLSGLNLQKLDTSSNLQLQVALNNATKDLPKGKGKKPSGLQSSVRFHSTFQFFRSNPKTRPFLLSQQPPSRTASDQHIRSSSKSHLREQTQTQRTTTGATRSTSSQLPHTAATTKSNKKSGFTLASPAVPAQEIEGEGDSDEWISSESLSVTPQNQSSDSESGDESDDVVHKLPANLNLTGAALAHPSTSPDDRDPPTPTIPQVKMQPPTPVNNVKEKPRHRLSITTVPNKVAATSAAHGDNEERSTASKADDQGSIQDDHHSRPGEDGLPSTPRPRAMVDRDTETSRHLPPTPLSNPPSGPNSTARESSTVDPRLVGGVQDRRNQPTLSIHSLPQPFPHITKDSPAPGTGNNPQGRDQITMTQVSEDLPLQTITNSAHF